MRKPWIALATGAVWVAAVAAGSTLVWGVISRAGTQVGADRPQPLPVATSGPQPTPGPTAPASVFPATPPTPTPVPVASESTATSSTTATSTSTSRSSTTSTTTRATTTTATSTVPAAARWVGSAGQIVAQCVQGTVTGTATPELGWSVSAERSSGTYTVEFKRGEDEVKIVASCTDAGGVRFAAES